MAELKISGWKDKVLFTPGPLTTSQTVKQALLRDLGSRDFEFIQTIKHIRQQLLEIGEVAGQDVANQDYEAILVQGSGTFGIEAVFSSFTPPNGKWLLIINGAYGKRMKQMAEILNIETDALEFLENQTPDLTSIETTLKEDPTITHIAIVHCETTTGIINPIQAIGQLAQQFGKRYFVDAMSSFGAIPINLADCHIDYLVSSANKCIEGVPGFSFVLTRRAALLETEGYARSMSLDLLAQWRGFEKNGQFRFTPPTHALLAFAQALAELDAEGGVAGRGARYKHNYDILLAGMRQLGFTEYLTPENQGYVITSFHYPNHPNFDFGQFYSLLNQRDLVIYPGKVSDADCFRIGNIGRIFEADVRHLLAAIREVLAEMNVELK